MPGPTPAPRLRPTPAFRASIGDAIVLYRSYVLATLAGFPHPASFSAAAHAATVPGTPLMVSRFRRLAGVIGYRGELFEPEHEREEVSA